MRDTDNLRTHGRPPFGVAVVHGGPGAGGEMAPVARELAGVRGVLEPIQTAMSVDEQIAELVDVLEAHAAPPVVLIGYSWGAWLACLAAVQRPALVGKLVLVGSGPFEASYAARIEQTRLSRLSADERQEVERLTETLGSPTAEPTAAELARFGALFAKADAYDPIPVEPAEAEPVACRADIFQSVWPEAAEMRARGELLERVGRIDCPVVAIHGDHDPHPADGVREPLATVLTNFRFILLERCGHTPWAERHARSGFFRALREELAT